MFSTLINGGFGGGLGIRRFFFWLSPARKAGARKLFFFSPPFTVHVAAPSRPISFHLCSLFSSKTIGEPNPRPRGRSHSGQGAPRRKTRDAKMNGEGRFENFGMHVGA